MVGSVLLIVVIAGDRGQADCGDGEESRRFLKVMVVVVVMNSGSGGNGHGGEERLWWLLRKRL